MPFPNEHSGRVREPFQFKSDSFRRKVITLGISLISGRLKGQETMTAQAYRFDKNEFTPDQARKWLKDHDIKVILFEPASEE